MTSLAQQASTLIEHGYKLLQAFSLHDKSVIVMLHTLVHCYYRYGGVVVHSMASINVLYDKLKEACQETSLSTASNK